MKKTLSFILCLVMIAAIAISGVSADETTPIDARELEAYGQHHFYLGAPATGTDIPNVEDAKVGENEYKEVLEFKKGDKLTGFSDADAGAGSYLDNEWHKIYVSYDEENIYLAYETKDVNYVLGKDGVAWCLSLMDKGSMPHAIGRVTYDIYPTSETDISELKITPRGGPKNDDGSWATAVTVKREDHIKAASGHYDAATQVLTVETAFKIDALKEYWGNDLALEDIRVYLVGFAWCYGPSVQGADDTVRQGVVWSYFPSNTDSNIKLNFLLDYPEISYWAEFFPHIVHFCEKPEPTTPAPTTTAEPTTTPEPTTAAPTTAKPTTAAPTTAAPIVADATTEAPKADKGCGSAIALSALALVPMLGAAVVFGKKKEN